jgi:F-type H+-transporting ATPase subunit delta
MRGASGHSLERSRESLAAASEDTDEQGLQRLGEELLGIVHMLDAEPRLRRILTDPASSADRRAGLISQLLEGRAVPAAVAVLDELARSSWSAPRDLVDALDDLAAQVLFNAAERRDALDDVEDELFRFSRILDREPELRTALTDPGLPADHKQSLLANLLDGKVQRTTLTLVREVVLYPRGRTIDRALEEYGRLAAARRERLVARVRVARPLTEPQLSRLSDALTARLGFRVHLNVEVDRQVLGGISVRVGDRLFDDTVVRHLADVRRLMTR